MTVASMPQCGVIVPSFNDTTLTRTCVEALLTVPPTRCGWRIIIVDDGSTDPPSELLAGLDPPVHTVRIAHGGFAAACNRGASEAGDCDYVVFLHSDTVVIAGWLDALVDEAAAYPEAAAVGAKLLSANGTVQHAGVAFDQNGWPRHLYAGFAGEHEAVSRPKRVAAASAACLLVRRDDFEQLGGFDESFEPGFEDVDLCLRLGEHGREVRYCPTSAVYHHLQPATVRRSDGSGGRDNSDGGYDKRWRTRVAPDDLQHYVDDGLISLTYDSHHPATLNVSPQLAVVSRHDEHGEGLEALLNRRSREVMELLSLQTRAALRDRARHPPFVLAAQPSPGGEAHTVARGHTRQLGDGPGRHLVSVVLPVKNGALELRQSVPVLLSQSVSARLEIIAVDSGSQDDTVEVLREFGATILSVEPRDFNHGLTRNLAAHKASGDVLLFLSANARPAGDGWLAPLLGALDEDPAVAGVCSRVVAHPEADLLARRAGELELSASPVRQHKRIGDWSRYEHMSTDERRGFLNFHTVSTAIRADCFRRVPFRWVATIGEDLLWAREVLEAGWTLVHEPGSLAYHSHDYTLGELFCRNVDDGIANRDINGRTLSCDEAQKRIHAGVDQDWDYLRDTLGLSGGELEHWQRESALRRIAQEAGQWLGVNHDQLPAGVSAAFSGIAHTRRGPGVHGRR